MTENYLSFLDPDKSVCFTGHRIVKKNLDEKEIENTIKELIYEGYENFYDGMAMGFDLLCYKILLKLKEEKFPFIKIIACVPCLTQNLKFPEKTKKIYDDYLKKADYSVIISDEYTEYCMKERDRYMVDNCAVCVSYLYKSTGGTYYTTSYAVSKNRKVIYIK
ncbi:MAG: SLOG family protein [Candidatus Borkfalkiaceae bacterium]|nr:SLOG family protein [bacterium]MDY2851473.1 SLOG family protein [Christensenellaceae bacterium]